jgi:hypothetical protein
MTKVQPAVNEYTLQPLGPDTWDAFAALAERHNGVWGGCWCTWFHTLHGEKTFSAEDNRDLKERLVNDGRAHAALVFDGDVAVAWCQYGAPDELPNMKHRKEYEAGLERLPTTESRASSWTGTTGQEPLRDEQDRAAGLDRRAAERPPTRVGGWTRHRAQPSVV